MKSSPPLLSSPSFSSSRSRSFLCSAALQEHDTSLEPRSFSGPTPFHESAPTLARVPQLGLVIYGTAAPSSFPEQDL